MGREVLASRWRPVCAQDKEASVTAKRKIFIGKISWPFSKLRVPAQRELCGHSPTRRASSGGHPSLAHQEGGKVSKVRASRPLGSTVPLPGPGRASSWGRGCRRGPPPSPASEQTGIWGRGLVSDARLHAGLVGAPACGSGRDFPAVTPSDVVLRS